ncbi:MAG: two-component system sensor histidine kinase NtrB, partial [Candidatus Krumholzibacteriia bacterium]
PPHGGDHGLMCVFDDLTARRAMEAQIRQLDKLAAIGRFTSSLAHEIRNPLAGIAAGIDYLHRDRGLGPEHQDYIRIISQEIDRLDRIIRHLFTVARPGYLMIRTVSLAPALERVLATLGPAAAQKRVTITTGLAGDWRELQCDEDQIQQVLLNLVKNAVEAEEEGGEVRVSIGAGEREGEAFGPPGTAADGVVVLVENGGEVIAAADRERIFEPFYSRKPGGTGLGLFVSFNIVKQHGGRLAPVDSPPGRTRFRLFLPWTQPRTTEVA